MKKKWSALGIALLISALAFSQTLFTYGHDSADAKDFLRAFNKNNNAAAANRKQAMKGYLDLYIASRLKIKEAYNRGYDTLPQVQTEIQNLRSQIIENYVNDPKTADKLLDEAFARSQKDIHVAHIFISFKDASGVVDTIAAERLANEVFDKLKKGADFSSLAQQYSSDPAAKTNKGEIGYITVLTLPYEFENIVYSTPQGQFSSPYRSKIGYHIFKNLGERKAVGRMKAAQVLLAFPPNADDATKKQLSLLADSIYDALAKGADIAILAKKYSNDYVSAASNGVIPDFTVGQYDPVFEKTFLSLQRNGAISKPFVTSHGYHIIKRIGIVPVSSDSKNKAEREELRARVSQSDRIMVARNHLAGQVLKTTPVTRFPYADKELWVFTDSVLNFQPKLAPTQLTRQSKLFAIGDKTVTVEDWLTYAQVWRFRPTGGQKPYPQVWDDFMHNQAENYYREHLENYNEDFRNQMSEFKEGNLFFEIMQNEVWTRAQNDSVALRQYYEAHKNNYQWKQSADAVIFFCSDAETGKILYDQLKKNPSAWKKAAEALGEKVVADSSRYEYGQIPHLSVAEIKPGTLTKPVPNKTDGTVSFAYILKNYPANLPRNLHDARGLVVSDYQAELEKKWVAELKKQYPVKMNQAEWEKINK